MEQVLRRGLSFIGDTRVGPGSESNSKGEDFRLQRKRILRKRESCPGPALSRYSRNRKHSAAVIGEWWQINAKVELQVAIRVQVKGGGV